MFFFDNNLLHIGYYKKIKYVENQLIIIELEKIILEIYGENLLIIQLTDCELYIQGTVKEIDLKNE